MTTLEPTVWSCAAKADELQANGHDDAARAIRWLLGELDAERAALREAERRAHQAQGELDRLRYGAGDG